MLEWTYSLGEARQKVIPNFKMVEDPTKEMIENSTEVADPNPTSGEELVTEVFPAWAVIRAMARRGTTEES